MYGVMSFIHITAPNNMMNPLKAPANGQMLGGRM